MAPPQTPSVTSNESGPRRASKLGYRRQRSQSPNKITDTQYRSRNMSDANIFIDHFPEPPHDVALQLKHIFEVSALEDIGETPFDHSSLAAPTQHRVEELVERYCSKSRQMAKECAGEGQWKSCLLSCLVEPVQELWPGIIKLSASEEPWTAKLRPTPPSFEDILGSGHPLHEPSTSTAELPLRLLQDPVLPGMPVLSPPSNTQSECTTEDPNRVSTPKPDMTVGLSHASFSKLQGRILWDLQDNNRVLGEPHQSGIGLHFPFLIVEAKGLAAGSNMFGAQNQAAVDGACALNILRDLKLATSSYHASSEEPMLRRLLFSIVTEGPIHELCVHYQLDDAYHITMLRIWRTTSRKEAKEFVRALCKILQWGVFDFRNAVIKELTTIKTNHVSRAEHRKSILILFLVGFLLAQMG